MTEVSDDLGVTVTFRSPPQRIVSLVPSLTEALAESVPDRLVAATDWCTHPPGLDLPRVRGTKNPNRAMIERLAPDLVIANQEENREIDVRRLRAAGLSVWVTRIETVEESFESMRRLFVSALGVGEPDWLTAARQVWSEPPRLPPLRVLVPIWRDPWMVVGPRTFTHDLLCRLGLVNTHGDSDERYPRVELESLDRTRADLVLLPDEPYVFTADDGPEAFPGLRSVLLSGRDLTWYGPALRDSRSALEAAIAAARR